MQRLRGLQRLARLVAASPAASAQNGRQQRSFGGSATGADPAAASSTRSPWLAAAAASLSVALGYQLLPAGGADPGAPPSGAAQCSAPAAVSTAGLPEFTREEVAQHRTKAERVWVTYKDGVYDVTDWVDQHPGGSARLLLAAGAAIDPFWAMYAQHNTEQVRGILEGYRIGRLKGGAPPAAAGVDPYANEPKDRHPALQARSSRPLNAETPKELLAASLITPNDLFYIRNHLPVPEVDPASFRLSVVGEGVREVELSMEDLRTRFKKHSVTATMQCTGNRRNDLNPVKKIKGLEWEGQAIGTAVWSGVLLRDVLRHAGLSDDDPKVKHIQFEGLDADVSGECYGASIPVTKALDPRGDVLLAFEMNGAPLSRDHGAPLRVLAPGVAGCRSVKWVRRVVASPDESSSFWQRLDYKSFSPSTDWDDVDWDSAPAIQNMPVTSGICEPANGTVLEEGDDEVVVKGYAWSGGGNGIVRVDVSADGGASWQVATLRKVPGQAAGRGWAWALWEAAVPVPRGHAGPLTLVAKATDESYNTQPERPEAVWNLRGVNCNSWPRVTVEVPSARGGAAVA